MILTDRQERIVLAALTELEERMQRGLANSGIGEAAAKLLRSPSVHDSEVTSLRQRFEDDR